MAYLRQSAPVALRWATAAFDGGFEFGVDEQRQAGADDVRQRALEVVAVDGGEAVAAGVDEEALEAGDAGERERFEVVLVAVDAAAPEGVVDEALAAPTACALEFERGDGGGLGQAVERHVDEGGEAAGGCGAGGCGKPSHSVRPGSLMWVWTSMRPGSRAREPRSSTGRFEVAGPGPSWCALR